MADNGNIPQRWYVLRAVSGKESKVKEYIDAEINNSSLLPYVTQVLIPTEKTFQVRSGKRIVKERNCLPGYVLVQASMVGDIAFKLRNTPNVVGILGGMDNPTPLQESEVNRLVGRVDEIEGEGVDALEPYIVGETVKVEEGPFRGFTGIIDDVNNEKKKLTVMVKVFGRNTPLILDFMQVKKELV